MRLDSSATSAVWNRGWGKGGLGHGGMGKEEGGEGGCEGYVLDCIFGVQGGRVLVVRGIGWGE